MSQPEKRRGTSVLPPENAENRKEENASQPVSAPSASLRLSEPAAEGAEAPPVLARSANQPTSGLTPKTQDAKPKTPPAWVKKPHDIGIVLGLVFFKPGSQKRLQQEADLRALTTACGPSYNGDFPAKDGKKGYWPRAAVVAWLAANVSLHKNKRKFSLLPAGSGESGIGSGGSGLASGVAESKTQDPRPKTLPGELPAQAKPAEGELFGTMSPAELAAVKKRRLDQFEDIHLHPNTQLSPSGGSYLKLSKDQRDELRVARPHLFSVEEGGKKDASALATEGSPEFSGGVEAVAAYIQVKFPGVICNKMDISNWRRAKFLPPGCNEPFPPSHNSGRNKKVLIDAWVLKWLKPPALGQMLPMSIDNKDYDRLQKKLNFERAQEEYKVWQQANDKKFIAREQANRTGTATGLAARNCTREALEKAFLKRLSSGLAEFMPEEAVRVRFMEKVMADAVSTFAEWQSNFTGALGALMKRNLEGEKTQ